MNPRVPWLPLGVMLCALLLSALGLAAIDRSEQFSGAIPGLAMRQATWLVVSVVGALAIAAANYRRVASAGPLAMGVVLVLLIAVYSFPAINGASRWIRIGPFSLQPAELAKLTYVIVLAQWLCGAPHYRSLVGIALPLTVSLVPILLILKEPDLGTALVFLPLFVLMVFIAGARRRDLAVIALAAVALLPLLWNQMSREQRSRILALAEDTSPAHRPGDDAYHLFQAKQMLALGASWGSLIAGEPTDDAGAYSLPAAATDFVLCVVAERFGFLGAAATLLLFALLIWQIVLIAEATREPLGRLIAAGIAALFAVEIAINAAMVVGLAPITGLPLPLVSYGGSGLLTHWLALGLVMSIGLRPGYEVSLEPFRFFQLAR